MSETTHRAGGQADDPAAGDCGRNTVVAIVAAAGSGTRLGADLPKAFVPVGGAAIISHAISGIVSSRVVDRVVVTAPSGMSEAQVRAAIASGGEAESCPTGPGIAVDVIAGGHERADSVARALAFIADQPWGAGVGVVLVHDAARCLTPPDVFRRVVETLRRGAVAVCPVVPVTDTIKTVTDTGNMITSTPERSTLRAAQTPQGFQWDTLTQANAKLANATGDTRGWQPTDDTSLVAWAGCPVVTVDGDAEALKITTPIDLVVAEHILSSRQGVST